MPKRGQFGAFYIPPNQSDDSMIRHKLFCLPEHAEEHFEVFTCIPLLKAVHAEFAITLKDKIFIKFDKDGDKKLSKKELKALRYELRKRIHKKLGNEKG